MGSASDGIGSSRHPSASVAAAAASSIVSVPTPSRDLSFRRGAYTKNIRRLEQSAEEMSAGGSDIGEEIRRMNELERSRSRESSIQSSHQDDIPTRSTPLDVPSRSRTGSGYANSIVDLNSNARVGGYSPSGYITSPTGSIKSSSWSRPSAHRNISTSSRNSRLANMIETDFEDKPLDLQLGYFAPAPARQMSQSSYFAGDDRRAGNDNITQSPASAASSGLGLGLENVLPEPQHARSGTATPPLRPNSTDTFQQAQIAFKDFDGVHYSPETDEYVESDQQGNEIRRVSARSSLAAALGGGVSSMLRAPDASAVLQGAPPPPEGMVYYPAPVPRMLNLPKRLSQLPAANMQVKRRTATLSQLPAARSSSPWLSSGDGAEEVEQNRQSKFPGGMPRAPLNERLSVANFSNVPPQLRASVFFEHQSVVQDVEVQSESAVATLDSILAASATAPVSAFTDHLYVGDTSKTSYAPERTVRRSTANNLRMSSLPQQQNNRASGLTGLLKRASTSNLLGQTLQTKSSRSTLPEPSHDPNYTPVSQDLAGHDGNSPKARVLTEGEQIDQDFRDEEELENIEEEDDAQFAQPTTLLAELQVRKAQQKSRNRTAATAFPNGMHSTLLQMDAVAEIDKKKRSHQRVALAWEDPNLKELDAAQEHEDEEVPLGVLFPNKNGLAHRKLNNDDDWTRPLGLMEKREMEDNEPLSSRRSRLRGEPIQRPRQQSPLKVAGVTEEGDDETLAHHRRRLSTKLALDGAISDVVPKDGSRPLSTFTDEVIGQLTGNNGQAAAGSQVPTAEDVENETLGQRRARLQREREGAERPGLEKRNSMSNLLATNPVGERKKPKQHLPAPGTLLHASDRTLADNKRHLHDANMRSASFIASRPQLVASQSAATLHPMYMQQQPMMAANNFGLYNGMHTSTSTPMFGAQANGYFPSPQMGMPMQGNPLGYGMLTGQSPMYPGFPSAQVGMVNYGPAMAQAYGFGLEGISVQQRAAIDRWRSSVMQ